MQVTDLVFPLAASPAAKVLVEIKAKAIEKISANLFIRYLFL